MTYSLDKKYYFILFYFICVQYMFFFTSQSYQDDLPILHWPI